MGVDLTTNYLGLTLKSPLVPSASPLTANLETLRKLEEAGAGAVVLPSLFEEQIVHEQLEVHAHLEHGKDKFAESLTYFPELEDYRTGPDRYLEHLAAAKKALGIPVIASLNGTSKGGWIRYAKMMEDAGADALELNIYLVATDPEASAIEVERRYLELIEAVREAVRIPLAVKLGPYFSAMAHMAKRIGEAGAQGLVLFNRFVQPDFNLEDLEVVPDGALSNPSELRLRLRWIAILKGRVDLSLAASGGVNSADDVVKLLLAGADVAQVASVLLRNGAPHLKTLLDGARTWLDEKEYASVEQLKGSMSQRSCEDPEAFERGQYMKALTSYSGEYI